MNFSASVSPFFAAFFGGWELVLVLAVVLILYTAGTAGFFGAIRRNDEFRRRREESPSPSAAEDDPAGEPKAALSRRDELVLWLAQGFDVGRIRKAPGTFGSLVGLLWVAVLLVPGSLACYLCGTLLGVALSVWCCGEAERILQKTDPGCIVLDEIVALPICFLPFIFKSLAATHAMPAVESFLTGGTLIRTVEIFFLFRCFDVAKPWPVRQLQRLPGGWGVTADDVAAGLYTAAVACLFLI
ncbi:MAG TPA: phosphatidylglycerophosphatase A [Candidatus Saccharimonadales bacterium]|nr:phosphatidylglycerophosphatase A [Candidatus Saccharimonadales bacterium]